MKIRIPFPSGRSNLRQSLRRWHQLVILGLLLVILLAPISSLAAPEPQLSNPDQKALDLLARMTPEEKVGQLFLITFKGTDLSPESEIYDLITNHHIGGTVLLADNDNFIGPEGTVEAVVELTQGLQRIEALSSQSGTVDPDTGEQSLPAYIPLFIASIQEGNSYPHDQILNGLSTLPSPMALGATWLPSNARQVGEILGQELEAIGVNLLLGPSLDVLESPSGDSQGDLGTRTFGGDPFWVGEMGKAYIAGLHAGSDNRVAVVAKHFPGHGGSDRLPEDEVATVRKSLEQLKLNELAPFFDVTGDAPSAEETVDGLLTSHIRYQGLQGNIRATTSPISFDPEAFERIMSLEPFVLWRENGGVVVSDDLGSRAVRRFFDPDGQTFNSRTVALSAFLAGNDMLYLGDFTASNDPDSTTSILRTIEFFAQKYQDDLAFAQRVDESVLRILTLKYRLYSTFSLNTVRPPAAGLETLGQGEQITFEIARQAATLISPLSTDLDIVLPEAPTLFDRIVFFTDAQIAQQCSECEEQPILSTNALQEAVVRLYGPDTGGQILPYNLVSFTFEALTNVLDTPPSDTILERTLRSADWVVFVMTNVDVDRPSSFALQRFLAEQPNLFRNKQLIVFAMDAPYYLDATDISKISAYYGLYSQSTEFIDLAARLLFKEVRPIPGALPVSVPGVGYDLISATSPDPTQTIPLSVEPVEPETPAGEIAPTPADQVEFEVGDLVIVRTGVILDHNGHPVPDDTPVAFILNVGGTELSPIIETTNQGMAETTVVLEAGGVIAIQARSGEPPALSDPLEIDLAQEDTLENPVETIEPPTVEPTTEASPTTVPPTPTATPEVSGPPLRTTDLADWFLAVIAVGVIGLVAYQTGNISGQIRWGFRWALCALLGGLFVYTCLSLNFPGAQWLLDNWGRWAAIILSAFGGGVGWGAGVMWRSIEERGVGNSL